MEVCADLHLRPYYDDEDDTENVYHSAKRGTTAFHVCDALRACKEQTLHAVRRLEDGDTASSVLAKFFDVLDGLDTEIKAVILIADSTTASASRCFKCTTYTYVIPIIRWGKTIQQELSEGWSRVIQRDLTGKPDGHSWTVEFPVYIDCTYLNRKYEKHGMARQRRSTP